MVNSASLNFGPDNIKENLSVHALQYLLYKLVGPGRQLSNDCTPEKLLPNYIACTATIRRQLTVEGNVYLFEKPADINHD